MAIIFAIPNRDVKEYLYGNPNIQRAKTHFMEIRRLDRREPIPVARNRAGHAPGEEKSDVGEECSSVGQAV